MKFFLGMAALITVAEMVTIHVFQAVLWPLVQVLH